MKKIRVWWLKTIIRIFIILKCKFAHAVFNAHDIDITIISIINIWIFICHTRMRNKGDVPLTQPISWTYLLWIGIKHLSQFKLPILIKGPTLSSHLFCKSHSAFKTTREDFEDQKVIDDVNFYMLKQRQIQQYLSWILGFWFSFVILFFWKLFLTLFFLQRLSYQRMYQVILLIFFLCGKFLYRGFLDNFVTIRRQHNFLCGHREVIFNSLLNSDKMNIFKKSWIQDFQNQFHRQQ